MRNFSLFFVFPVHCLIFYLSADDQPLIEGNLLSTGTTFVLRDVFHTRDED